MGIVLLEPVVSQDINPYFKSLNDSTNRNIVATYCNSLRKLKGFLK